MKSLIQIRYNIILLVLLEIPKSIMSLSTSAAASSTIKNIVVVGGGIQGTSVAYHLAKHSKRNDPSHPIKITILESKEPASAASGKGGGFMARSWGDGSPTQRLHELAFDMYEELATHLECTSYRKLPVLSVSPGYRGIDSAKKDKRLGPIMPQWLDGDVGRISALGYGDDTAQITPKEFVDKMLDATKDQVQVLLGTCCGVDTDQGSQRGNRKIIGVKYQPRSTKTTTAATAEDSDTTTTEEECYSEEQILPADVVIVSAGPWSCAAEDWFQGAVELPMEGIKSTRYGSFFECISLVFVSKFCVFTFETSSNFSVPFSFVTLFMCIYIYIYIYIHIYFII
jgi:hypothetical protein